MPAAKPRPTVSPEALSKTRVAVVRHDPGMNLEPCQRQISVQVGHEGRLGRVFLPK